MLHGQNRWWLKGHFSTPSMRAACVVDVADAQTLDEQDSGRIVRKDGHEHAKIAECDAASVGVIIERNRRTAIYPVSARNHEHLLFSSAQRPHHLAERLTSTTFDDAGYHHGLVSRVLKHACRQFSYCAGVAHYGGKPCSICCLSFPTLPCLHFQRFVGKQQGTFLAP